MQPARFILTVWKGGTFRMTITVYQTDGVTPQNYTGYTAALTMYTLPGGGSPLYSMTTSNGKITLGGTAGTVALYIPAVDTLTFGSWTPESAIYELDLVASGGTGDTTPLLWGPVEVRGIV